MTKKQKARQLFKEETKNPLSAIAIMPNGVTFESQNEGENVYMLLRQHWVTNLPWIIQVLIGIFLPFFAMFVYQLYVANDIISSQYIIVLWVVWYLLLFSFAFFKFLRWFFNAYIITNERLLDIDYYGLMYHKISEASLLNIEDVASGHVGLWQNLFDFGHVRVQTAAERHEIGFENVPRPGYIQDKIMDLASIVKNKN